MSVPTDHIVPRKNKVLTYEITLSDSQARREKAAKPPT